MKENFSDADNDVDGDEADGVDWDRHYTFQDINNNSNCEVDNMREYENH